MSTDDLDASLKLLSDGQRRRIIHHLRDGPPGEISIEELVDLLHDDGSASSTGKRPDRDVLALQLVHKQLPKLDEHSLIHHDRKNGVVRYRPDERIETVLDALPTGVTQTLSDS